MADQNSQYMAMLTAVGEAKLANATALGVNLNITQLGVGDANGVEPMPSRTQTALINERRRAPLNQLSIDPNNSAIIIAEQVIPEDVGGWWIREIGLYDEAGDLVAVSNCPPTFKPELAQGSGRTQVVRLNILVSSTQNIQLKIDPSVVLATRAYADSLIVNHLAAADPHPQYTTEAEVAALIATEMNSRDSKQSVRFTTTANINLSGLTVQAGGDWAAELTAGDRILVKDQANGASNGIYVAASGAWIRAMDADASLEVTPGMLVPVEQGAVSSDSIWQLATDSPITVGTTPLAFEMVSGPTGVVAGSYRSVTVDKRGRVIGGTNPTTLEGYGIADALKLAPGHVEQRRVSLSSPNHSGLEGTGNGGAIEVREAQLVAEAQAELEYAPSILFHWAGRFAAALAMDAAGKARWGEQFFAMLSDLALASAIFGKPNGHIRLPAAMGGFMLQWCDGPQAGAESVTYAPITFPVPFPNECVFAGAFTRMEGAAQADQIFQTAAWTRLDVTLFPQWFGTGTQGLVRPLILSLGY
ncbi:phage tail protein [Pseudomonas stutzeri]|uniref:phage tail protein n=1 Tax=Stutzerimonas stutzeri TaxID=316 RepID=UPI001E39D903|nr:phage tail protein [Stutzerimonas stutzeri]MCC8342818.1 phage tail protein [Stutzerimonas stutzeri]